MLVSLFSMGLTKTLLGQQAPTITAVGGGAPATCMSPNPANANYTATYQVNVPANISVTGLNAGGDLVITAQPCTYPINGGSSGTTFTVTVQSTNNSRELSNTCDNYLLPVTPPIGNELGVNATNWGFAKARLSVNWNTGSCNDLTSLDIFKSFTLHPRIIGPKCIKEGDKITFSVCNILSGRNTPSALGQDKYYWTGSTSNNYDNTIYPDGLYYLYSSADGSSITFKVIDYTFIGKKLYCRFGQCNPTTVSDVTLSAITFPPTLSVRVGGITIAPASTNPLSYCIAPNVTQIVIAGDPPNVPQGFPIYNYELSSNNYGWGFPTTQTLAFSERFSWSKNATIGIIGGEIYVKTSGTCDTRTDVIKINRNLNTPTYYITSNSLIGGNCILAGSRGEYTITPYPGNVAIGWSSQWPVSPNTPSNGNTISLTAGTTNAILTATTGNCVSNVQLPLYVRPAAITAISVNSTQAGSPFCIPRPINPQTFTAVGGANAASFVWSFPNLWANSGNGSSSITLTPNAGAQTGNVSVYANSTAPGNTCTSNAYGFATVYALNPGTITGPTCIPAGNADAITLGAALTNVGYSVPAVSGATYQWTVPSGMYVPGTLPSTTGNS